MKSYDIYCKLSKKNKPFIWEIDSTSELSAIKSFLKIWNQYYKEDGGKLTIIKIFQVDPCNRRRRIK